MARYRGIVESARSPEETFAYMAEFANVQEWDPTVVEARALQEGEPSLGSRFFVRVHWLGRDLPLTYELTEYEPPRRLVLRAENSTSVSEDTVEVEPGATGARLVYDARVELKGAARLLDPLLGLAFRRLGDGAAAGLRRELGRA
ncbi:MAG: SRPBCC family protein [Solirubrobacterales bacterium]